MGVGLLKLYLKTGFRFVKKFINSTPPVETWHAASLTHELARQMVFDPRACSSDVFLSKPFQYTKNDESTLVPSPWERVRERSYAASLTHELARQMYFFQQHFNIPKTFRIRCFRLPPKDGVNPRYKIGACLRGSGRGLPSIATTVTVTAVAIR